MRGSVKVYSHSYSQYGYIKNKKSDLFLEQKEIFHFNLIKLIVW